MTASLLHKSLLASITAAYLFSMVKVTAFQTASTILMPTKNNHRSIFLMSSFSNNEFDFILYEGAPRTVYDKLQRERYANSRAETVTMASTPSAAGRSGKNRPKQNWFNYDPDPNPFMPDYDEDDYDDDVENDKQMDSADNKQEMKFALEEEDYIENEEQQEGATKTMEEQLQSSEGQRQTMKPTTSSSGVSSSIRLPRQQKPRSVVASKAISYPSVSRLLQEQDYLGIMWKWGIPVSCGAIGIAAATKYVTDAYQTKGLKMCEAYANEMVYHDGDFEEMKLCHRDWKRKMRLYFPIPSTRKTKMLSSYLETFTKKKPVSPQAVSSLSFLLTMYKLTEQQAARILTQVAKKQLGQDKKPASAGKLLFFGTRILKSPEAKADLLPIRQMLASSYKVGGDLFVTNSQKTMGEAAYKTAVAAAGKDAASDGKLTPGWEVLGLDKETAQRLYDEVANDGFVTGAQKLYGEKFFQEKDEQKKNEKKEESIDEGDATPSGMVYECSECGYTMFPAKGREFKFLPPDFKCPECGAAKDKFVDLSKMD